MTIMVLDITHTYGDHYFHEKRADKYIKLRNEKKKLIYYKYIFLKYRPN